MIELIGQKVNVHKHDISWTSAAGKTYHSVSVIVDDPQMHLRISQQFTNQLWRWKLPGGVYTADYNPNRVNIRIDKEGFIKEVFTG